MSAILALEGISKSFGAVVIADDLGVVAIGVMLKAPKGIWGYAADRLGWQLFPLARHLERGTGGKGGRHALRTGTAGHSDAPPPTEPVRGLP